MIVIEYSITIIPKCPFWLFPRAIDKRKSGMKAKVNINRNKEVIRDYYVVGTEEV